MILLTGSTGFLGRELLGRMLLSRPDTDFCLLIRPGADESANLRARRLLIELFGPVAAQQYSNRIMAVDGDLSEPQFGLGDSDFNNLGSKITEVHHCAATTRLNEDLETSRKINVGGTQNVLSLAKISSQQHASFRFFHVSTAYVAGNTEQVVAPDELDIHRSFRNSYEKTKAEAEGQVRACKELMDVCIFRPSIIVGDSETGQTSAFNVLYVPLRLMLKGLFKALPARPHIPFDVVPVNYVAEAMVQIAATKLASGECFHLSAGVGRESTPLEIIELVIKAFNNYWKEHFRAPVFISPELLTRALSVAAEGLLLLEKRVCGQLGVFRQTLPFIPYMLSNPRFDTTATQSLLGERLSPPPLFSTYAEQIFRYCFETNWGKKPFNSPQFCS